jgi:hypothetical protein
MEEAQEKTGGLGNKPEEKKYLTDVATGDLTTRTSRPVALSPSVQRKSTTTGVWCIQSLTSILKKGTNRQQ